jgi:hypothetical protein
MKKRIQIAMIGLLTAGVAQAALLTDIDGSAAVVDWSGADFTNQTLTTSIDNWGRNDNFSEANFSDAIFNFDGGNQPFLAVDISDADFTGATFNWTPYTLSGQKHRVNMFRNATGSAGADFSDTVWDITLNVAELDNTDFFNNGAGAADVANKADAMNFSGADFNFLGTDTSLADDIGALLISNLGSTGTGAAAFGAKYDSDFVNNNYSDFGYVSAVALETDLTTAGWQVIPEPATLGLVSFASIAMFSLRRFLLI